MTPMSFKKGDIVKIRCEAQPGPFDDVAVTISSDAGVVSGFVKQNLVEQRGNDAFVLGKVIKVEDKAIEVQIPGSFFTSALGITSLPRAWADSNMEHA
jgi:hypothetical protein